MILQKIVLGADEESKRKAIQENIGQHVILEDDHQRIGHAELLDEPKLDTQCYWARFGDGREVRKLHYHDLQSLVIIANHPKFPRPELVAKEESLQPSQAKSESRSIPVLIGTGIGFALIGTSIGFIGIYGIQKAVEYLQK